MKTLRSSLVLLGLLFMVGLLAPVASFAQEDSPPPCCDSVIVLPLEDGTFIILVDTDAITPVEEGQPVPDPIAQLLTFETPALLPERAVDQADLALAPRELYWALPESLTQKA